MWLQTIGPLQRAIKVVLLLWSAALLALLGCTFDLLLQPSMQQRDDARLIQILQLSSLALLPSARAGRALELRHPAVDLRHHPSLPTSTSTP